MFNTKEIGIYIHIPFCKSKCYYCDFNSYTKKDYLIPEYCKALINEIQLYSSRLKKLCGKRIKTNSSNTLNGVNVLELEDIVCGNTEIKVKSIYIGGGTPSLLPLSYI